MLKEDIVDNRLKGDVRVYDVDVDNDVDVDDDIDVIVDEILIGIW